MSARSCPPVVPQGRKQRRAVGTLFASALAVSAAASGVWGLLCFSSGRAASPVSSSLARRAKAVEGDEFDAARERIRRIQLGLSDSDPLPPEENEGVIGQVKTLDVADAADKEAEALKVNITSEIKTTDSAEELEKKELEEEEKRLKEIDAFAGKADDVPELKPEEPSEEKPQKNFIEGIQEDFALITLPSTKDVINTFGIVVLLVGGYTGFVALVDYGSQQVLGQVFSEFYQAARPEAPSM